MFLPFYRVKPPPAVPSLEIRGPLCRSSVSGELVIGTRIQSIDERITFWEREREYPYPMQRGELII